MNEKHLLVVVIAGLIALSGCPQGSGGNIGFIGNNEINATNNGFFLNHTVGHLGLTEQTFSNVTVYLYKANGAVIEHEHLGTLSEDNELRATMQTDQIPKYIIINSPEFWGYDEIGVRYYENIDYQESPNGVYSERTITSKDEFPVDVPPNSADAGSQ